MPAFISPRRIGIELTSGLGSARWRRSATSFTNRLAAARVRAWSWWRGTTAQQQKGGPSGLGNLGSTTRPHGRGRASWRRGGWRTTAHAGNHGAHGSVTARTAVTARSPRSQHARSGHDTHATITAHTHWSRRTQRTWRARFNHGARASTTARATVTACTSRSLQVRRGTAGAVDRAGQRPRQRD
jgi:hypothetical protein